MVIWFRMWEGCVVQEKCNSLLLLVAAVGCRMLRWMSDVQKMCCAWTDETLTLFFSLLSCFALKFFGTLALWTWHNNIKRAKEQTQTNIYCNRSWRAVSYPSFVFLTVVARWVLHVCLLLGRMFEERRNRPAISVLESSYYYLFVLCCSFLRCCCFSVVFLIMVWLVQYTRT